MVPSCVRPYWRIGPFPRPPRSSLVRARGSAWRGGAANHVGRARRVHYRTWIVDSRRWEHYRPRPTDIVIATYPKCGTTWMQRIVGLLVFQTPEPRPIMQISAWIDRRFPEPIEAMAARIEAQDHRRFLKTHLPFDGLPIYDEVKYVHVARDGRDACMSFHNHGIGLHARDAGQARPGRPGGRDHWPPLSAHRRRSGRAISTAGSRKAPCRATRTARRPCRSSTSSGPGGSERHRPNVLLVHYNDLKADLSGEMRRVADFLGISVPPDTGPGSSRPPGSRPCAGTARP